MSDTTAAQLSLADLSLFPATREQTIESRKRTLLQWGRGRSIKEYLHTEVILETREPAIDGKFVVWVLAPRSDPTTIDFLCSCETFRRSALVSRQSGGSSAPDVKEVTAYGVASVFTPAQKRGKGYARHMMRLLHWVLAPRSALSSTFPEEWGVPPDEKILESAGVGNAQFSVLYSDIGSDFYRSCGLDATSRNGWYVTGAKETSWHMNPEADLASHVHVESEATESNVNLRRLTVDEVIKLYSHDTNWIKDDLSRPPCAASASDARQRRTRFTFLPNKGVGAFAIIRCMTLTPDLQPSLPSSQWASVIFPPSTSDLAHALATESVLPFISWTFDSVRDARIVVVTRLRADEHTFPILLEEIKAVARQEKAAKIEFWYLQPELRVIAEGKGWRTTGREEHLSAVKWYGDEEEDELDWVYNEKFCWC
ncbi:hypothetical protein BD309DRAFT_964638 [Dichomitus squalens]|nr:hypothetical protein BD309DRAFT_964638 [Dichomitus squalens]